MAKKVRPLVWVEAIGLYYNVVIKAGRRRIEVCRMASEKGSIRYQQRLQRVLDDCKEKE